MKKKITVEVEIETNGKYCGRDCGYIEPFGWGCSLFIIQKLDLDRADRGVKKLLRCKPCLKATGDL